MRNKIKFLTALLFFSTLYTYRLNYSYGGSIFSKLKAKKNKKQPKILNKAAGKDINQKSEIIPLIEPSKKAVKFHQPYIEPSEKAIKAVVFIKSTQESKVITRRRQKHPLDDLLEKFFNEKFPETERYKSRPRVGAGSGVIISNDGYIVTNNHVVNGADKLEVTLNNGKQYKAKLIGADMNTDIAVIKIEEKNLPYLKFADSDKVKVGELVLAIGNPFGLKATVTNGIISAKGRSRSELNPHNPMEIGSFLQTNAIINVGNSGGALVNLDAEIVGINTAMLAPVSGYGFAAPSNVVKAVVSDIMKFGIVQKGILNITGINALTVKDYLDQPGSRQRKELLKEMNEKKLRNMFKRIKGEISGIVIVKALKGKAADKAGLRPYDIIIGIDNKPVDKMYELQEVLIKKYKPGDKITIQFLRNGAKKNTSLTLETDTKYRVLKITNGIMQTNDIEGAIFENVDSKTLSKMKIKGGAQIKKLSKGKWQAIGIRQGFIVTNIVCLDCSNKYVEIDNIKTLCLHLNNLQGGKIVIEGRYPGERSSEKEMYALYW